MVRGIQYIEIYICATVQNISTHSKENYKKLSFLLNDKIRYGLLSPSVDENKMRYGLFSPSVVVHVVVVGPVTLRDKRR